MRPSIQGFRVAVACLGVLASVPAGAQSASGLLSDATVLPTRAIRFGAFTSFTRWDALLGSGPTHNLAGSLANDAVGSAQLPILAPSETDIQSASALSSFRLNIGQLTAVGNARIFTMPLIAEYGLTPRLTVGISIPIVETRTTLVGTLNPALGLANVGVNPALGDNGTSAQNQNAALVTSLRAASDTLQRRVTLCQTSPTNPICSTINGQQAAAQSLIQTASAFAAALESLYGTGAAHPGDAFVPLVNGPAATAITNRVTNLNTQFQTFVNRALLTGSVANALAPAARDQLQSLLAAVGHDSLQVADRDGIGDISIGATYQLANSFGDTSATAGLRYRLALNGTFRIGTGQPANRNRFFDNGTGYGQHGVAAAMAADVALSRRYSASMVGSYTLQLGTVAVNRVPNAANAAFPLGPGFGGTYSAGDLLSVTLMPRVRLAGYFSFNGLYSLVHTGADVYTFAPPPVPAGVTLVAPVAPYGLSAATAQQVGFGFSYSTINGPNRGPGAIPFEVAFNHLETISASGGPVGKTFQDRVELKVFLLR